MLNPKKAIVVVTGAIQFVYGPLASDSWARGTNTATKRADGQWEQVFFNGEVRLVYDPGDFRAGGRQAKIYVQNTKPDAITINGERSRFVGEGLKEEDIVLEPTGREFGIQIPDNVPPREIEYVLSFDCSDAYKKFCKPGSFFVPVFNERYPLLKVDVKGNPIFVSVWRNTTPFEAELTSANAFYDIRSVRIAPDPRYREAFSIGSIEFATTTVDKISAGSKESVWVRVDRTEWWDALWTYVQWDLSRAPVEVNVKYLYLDQYERRWPPTEGKVKIEYSMPFLLRLTYYFLVLFVFSVIGNVIRLIVGTAVPRIRSELRNWVYSWLLAGVLAFLGLLLQAKIEPLGAFELGFTNVRGIMITGVAAGLFPDEIKKRIQSLFGRMQRGNPQAPGGGEQGPAAGGGPR